MNKKNISVIVIISSILLILVYVISNTYSVIIETIEGENGTEIINNIKIRDLLTDDNGNYNNTYYEVVNELSVDDNDINILMNSESLNAALQIVLNDIVNYRLHGGNRLTREEIYNLIENAIYSDDNIDQELKNKILIKSNKYINDVYNYLYGIKVSSNGSVI